MAYRSRPNIGPNDKVVAYRCRSKSGACQSTQAIVRKLGNGVTQFICVECGHVSGVNQGGSINL